jgi:cytidylate kinase
MTQNPAITISRSLGSGGTEIGFLVARRLGWHFCDRRILRLAAEAMGHSIAGMAQQEERHCGFLDQMMNTFGFGSPEAHFTPLLELPMYSQDLYALEREVMLRLVAQAPSVIVGRGGFAALKGRPATLHVSIHADPAFRVQHLLARGKAPNPEAARKAIVASDRDRAAFIRTIAGLDWHDPRNFDLVLDPSRIGLEACVEHIAEELDHCSR